MRKTRTAAAALALAALLVLPSCRSGLDLSDDAPSDVDAIDGDDTDTGSDPSSVTAIALSDSGSTVAGSGASVSGSVATISEAGYYEASGSVSNGRIVVAAAEDAVVHLTLSGASIACSTGAPIYAQAADKLVITLSGDANSVSTTYSPADGVSPDAAIYADCDLTLNGSGSISVASACIGVKSTDDLKVTGGKLIEVHSSADGLRGKDSVTVAGGAVSVTSTGGDGLSSTNDQDATKGFIVISGGTVDVVTGGGSSKAASSTVSTKGIKAVTRISISGGTISVNSSDDAVHCDRSIAISGGSLTLAANSTAGQGIKFGDSSKATISGDSTEILITSSVEGIAGYGLTISGSPVIRVAASNDGFSLSAGTVAGGAEYDDGSSLVVEGGRIVVSSSGDGIDSNGSVEIDGGTLIVCGGSSPEEGLDHNGTLTINGGLLVALSVGSSGGGPKTSSTTAGSQRSATFTLSTSYSTTLHIQSSTDSSGGIGILTLTPARAYQRVVMSSPSLAAGTYYAYTGGSVSGGAAEDGLYSGGSYSGGTQRTSFSVN
jgi:hypothetical protein